MNPNRSKPTAIEAMYTMMEKIKSNINIRLISETALKYLG